MCRQRALYKISEITRFCPKELNTSLVNRSKNSSIITFIAVNEEPTN